MLGHKKGQQVCGAGDQQHVRDNIVVVSRDGAGFGEAHRDGVRCSGEYLLITTRDDEHLEEAADAELPSFIFLLSVEQAVSDPTFLRALRP